jgi:hypothetical protein
MLVPVVVTTARYHNSKEFNSNADSLETFKCHVIAVTVMKILFHCFFPHYQQHCYHHVPTVNPEAATAVVEVLMVGVRTPETC